MKYFIIIFLFIVSVANAQNSLETGKRQLKLGLTYLLSGDLDNAKKFLDLGQGKVGNLHYDIYWQAVYNEYLGYYYIKANMPEQAKSSLNEALSIYNTIITQQDGSKKALSIDQLNTINENIQQISTMLDNGMSNMAGFQPIEPLKVPNEIKPGLANSTLNFDNNKFEKISSNIPKDIRNLSLSNCRIKDGSFISDLKEIEYLNLSKNNIKTLPNDIGQLKNLIYLDLSENRLANLPVDEFKKLTNLRVLNLKGNNRIKIEDILNLVRYLPLTNIYIDVYEPIDENEEELD